jgi:hypothetical protein
MRRLITALASLAVVFLLVPNVGLAIDPPADNNVGVLAILTSEDLGEATNFIEDVVPFATKRIYFVLFHPQIPGSQLGAMTFSWRMDPVPATTPFLQLMEPAGTVRLGDSWNVIMGYGLGVQIIDSRATCLTVDVTFTSTVAPTLVYLGPPEPTSIPGYMEYNDLFQPQLVFGAVPNSNGGSYDEPVFGFNVSVPTEGETWGGVKALFN